MSTTRSENPAPLVVAASLAAVEAFVLLALAAIEVGSFSSLRGTMGATTAVFFVGSGVALLWCAWSVTRGHAWARSPLLLAQLIQLGLAWSFRDTLAVTLALAIVAIVVIAGLLHPASLEALSDDPTGDRD